MQHGVELTGGSESELLILTVRIDKTAPKMEPPQTDGAAPAPSSPAQLQGVKAVAMSALAGAATGTSAGAAAVGKAVPVVTNYFWGPKDEPEAATASIRNDSNCSSSADGTQPSRPIKAVAVGAVAGAATGTAAVAAAVPVIHAVGFTVTGITAGSTAAGMMSSAVVGAGGAISSGSTVAVLQSIGALSAIPGGVIVPVALGAAAVGMAVPAVS